MRSTTSQKDIPPRADLHSTTGRTWPITTATVAGLLMIAILTAAEPAVTDELVWAGTTPEEQGIDSAVLVRLLESIRDENLDLHSVILFRNNKVVLECYLHPYDRDTLHNVKSVSKSVVSALVGIALEKKIIKDVDQSVQSFLPQYFDKGSDPRKKQIILKHLLSMQSGLDLDENGPIEREIVNSDDWVGTTLARPLTAAPGSRFLYSTPLTHIMSAILSEASGSSLLNFADEHLFKPLDIGQVQWVQGPKGYYVGGADLFLTPRAMAKLGLLYSRQGRWLGAQIVPSQWVEVSTRAYVDVRERDDDDRQYGYWWWRRPSGRYSAIGWGGQIITIRPDQSMVVVTTSAGWKPVGRVLEALRSILPKNQPLPSNPEGFKALQEIVRQLESPQPEPVPALPKTAEDISGRTYQLSDNTWGMESVRFDFAGENSATVTFTERGTSYTAAVGLDNVYRITDRGTFGMMPLNNRLAMKGQWTNETTFTLECHELGRPAREIYIVSFDDNRLGMSVSVSTTDDHFSLTGTSRSDDSNLPGQGPGPGPRVRGSCPQGHSGGLHLRRRV